MLGAALARHVERRADALRATHAENKRRLERWLARRDREIDELFTDDDF